jgi:hypothetical protein
MSAYEKIVDRIQVLSVEQLRIYSKASQGGFSDAQRSRLAEVKSELQNLWFLRKQGRTHLVDPLDAIGREKPRWA